jgi:hypothetical protein
MFRAVVCLFVAVAIAWSPQPAAADRAARFQSLRDRASQQVAALPGQPTVRWRADQPTPAMVRGIAVATAGRDPAERARSFLHSHPGLVAGELVPVDTRSSRELTVVRLAQLYRGVPVLDATVTVALDHLGRVRALHASTHPVELKTVRPRVDGARARRIVLQRLRASGPGRSAPAGHSSLAVLPGAPARLVQVVSLPLTHDPRGRRHLVDALTGDYLGARVGVIVDGQEVRR